MAEFVRTEIADGVARITLDSPHNRNALSARVGPSCPPHWTPRPPTTRPGSWSSGIPGRCSAPGWT